MNKNLGQLEERLTRATAPAASPEAGLDEQTASLREAWLAFGQLLETAHAGDGPVRLAAAAPPTRRALVPTVLALAASLLVATSAFCIVQAARRSLDSASPDALVAAGGQHSLPGARTSSSAAEPDLAWEDPLDSDIVVAGQAVLSVRQEVMGLADASHSVEYGLEQVDKEIQNEPL